MPPASQRSQPYADFRFRVKWDDTGAYVLGVSRVSGLTRSTQVSQFRAGGDPSMPHLVPGQTAFGPITLERGLSHDVAFEQWANKVFDLTNANGAAGPNTSLVDFRKELTLDLYNEAGMKVLSYRIHNAWASEFTAMPELDGSGNALAVQSITLQNEGWERVDSTGDDAEPSPAEPETIPPG
jgi:phage tail-like protein